MTPESPSFYEANKNPILIKIHEIQAVLGDGWASLEFDKGRYTDPTYLSMCRFLLADVLRATINSEAKTREETIKALLQRNLELGIRGKGLLWEDDIEQILHHDVVFPLPWTPERCKMVEPPSNYMGVGAAFDVDIPRLVEQDILVGFTSGVWDLGHAGHYRFLYECYHALGDIQTKEHKKGRVLIVGVDENALVGGRKGDARPLMDFAVRVGTLSGVKQVAATYRVMDLQASYSMGVDDKNLYTSFPINLINPVTIHNPIAYDQLEAARRLLEASDPRWVKTYGNNFVFFWSETDPLADFKNAWAEMIGSTGVGISQYTSLSTTDLASHFGVRQTGDMPNRFGKDPWWISKYVVLTRSLR